MHKLTIHERLVFLLKKASADQSKFLVSSIIVTKDGQEHNGVNVEYEIPTNSLCAERNAITTAVTTGMKLGDVAEVHIIARNLNKEDEESFTPPCGACRQAIFEASNGEAKVFLYNFKGDVKEFTITELIPEAFTGVER